MKSFSNIIPLSFGISILLTSCFSANPKLVPVTTENIDNIPLLVLETPNEFYGEKIGEEQFEEIYMVNKLKENINNQSIIIQDNDLKELLSFLKKDSKTRTFVFNFPLRSLIRFILSEFLRSTL